MAVVVQPVGTDTVVSAAGVIDAKFSNDGTRFYVAEGQTVRAIAVATGETLTSYILPTNVGAMDVSTDGRYLVTVGRADYFRFTDAPYSADAPYKVSRIDLVTGTVETADSSHSDRICFFTTYHFKRTTPSCYHSAEIVRKHW